MRSRRSRGCASARMPTRSRRSAAPLRFRRRPSRRRWRQCGWACESAKSNCALFASFAAGAESLAFPPIVVAGAQSAEGHGHAGDYQIRPGDTLLFDFGAAVGGYNADVTRTVFVGEPAAEARALYGTVYEANRIGRGFARPGISAGAVDDTVQTFLEKSPFVEGDLIKTGHGLGLDVHEAPQIMRGNDMVLEPGMVFTIEPGLYLAGRRGVRIEDDVVVTDSTLRIRGEARMSRIPLHFRSIKIKELREMQKRGLPREKQLYADVLGTKLLASANRPKLKRY